MEIKTTMRYHYRPIRISNRLTTPNAAVNVEQLDLLSIAAENEN